MLHSPNGCLYKPSDYYSQLSASPCFSGWKLADACLLGGLSVRRGSSECQVMGMTFKIFLWELCLSGGFPIYQMSFGFVSHRPCVAV